jgi:hypothetical protein
MLAHVYDGKSFVMMTDSTIVDPTDVEIVAALEKGQIVEITDNDDEPTANYAGFGFRTSEDGFAYLTPRNQMTFELKLTFADDLNLGDAEVVATNIRDALRNWIDSSATGIAPDGNLTETFEVREV